MPKQSGLGMNLYIGGYNVSGDIGVIDELGGGPEPMNLTGIDKSAFERAGGLRDGRLKYTSWFNPDAAQSHVAHSTLPTTDANVQVWYGTALGSPVAAITSKQLDYGGNRGDDGSLTMPVEHVGNGFGLEWGVGLTAGRRQDTTGTNGTSVDLGTGTLAFGAQAYFQVFSFTGTLASINVQGSSDNGAGDPFANIAGLSFAVAPAQAPKAERAATADGVSIERYVRVVTGGVFTEMTFALMVVRNHAAVVF